MPPALEGIQLERVHAGEDLPASHVPHGEDDPLPPFQSLPELALPLELHPRGDLLRGQLRAIHGSEEIRPGRLEDAAGHPLQLLQRILFSEGDAEVFQDKAAVAGQGDPGKEAQPPPGKAGRLDGEKAQDAFREAVGGVFEAVAEGGHGG